MAIRTALAWMILAGCYSTDPLLQGLTSDGEDTDESSSVSATSSSAASSTAVSSSGSGGTGGEGGGSGCGDGTVDADEECDDQNAIDLDGCTACEIDCDATELKDPVSGNCYAVLTDLVDRPTAEAACQAWGGAPDLGHLASLEDQAENDLVAPLSIQNTWIGADDLGGDWAWVDDTIYAFENFQDGEPNHPGTEHCMFMDVEARWHDHDCADLRPAYLCERRGAGTF